MGKRKRPMDIPEVVVAPQAQLAADVTRLARELSGALHRAREAGVQMEIAVETVAIAGRPSLQQVMAYVISFSDENGGGAGVRLRKED